MNRETKIIETPIGKHKIEIKTYLTGREKRAITNVYLESGIEVSPDSESVKGITPEFIDKAQDLAWNTIVCSIDGNAENIVNTILDMRIEDYEFVVSEVNKITTGSSFEEKKTT